VFALDPGASKGIPGDAKYVKNKEVGGQFTFYVFVLRENKHIKV